MYPSISGGMCLHSQVAYPPTPKYISKYLKNSQRKSLTNSHFVNSEIIKFWIQFFRFKKSEKELHKLAFGNSVFAKFDVLTSPVLAWKASDYIYR